MKTKILSSISGRMRMKVDGLLYNENTLNYLKNLFNCILESFWYHQINLLETC